jgi:hypothetical protein
VISKNSFLHEKILFIIESDEEEEEEEGGDEREEFDDGLKVSL